MDKIVHTILGIIGATFEIPRLIVRYGLGLTWTGYMAIRGKDAKIVFSKLNTAMVDDIRWVLDEFKFFL